MAGLNEDDPNGGCVFRADSAGKGAPPGTIFPLLYGASNPDYAKVMRLFMRVFDGPNVQFIS
jgi:hypothetical protein